MRAGLLRHFLEVYRQVDKRDDTGAVSQVRKHMFSMRANLLKQSGYTTQNSVEQANKMTLVFQTWLYDELLDTDTIEWSNQEFNITLIEKDILSRTMKIHLQKINK